MSKIGENEPCPCGSGKKYKWCHLHNSESLLITNEPPHGALVVPFNFEQPAKLQADLEIPTHSLPISFLLPGKFILGKDFWDAAVEMVCVDSDSSFPESSLPFYLLMPSHRQVWRARIFHFSRDILLRAITTKTPFKLDLSAPSVPFVEFAWHPERGFHKSFHGLEHVDPKDTKTVVRALEKNFKRWALIARLGQRTRPEGLDRFNRFVNEIYMKYSRENKASWKHDEFRCQMLCEHFGSKRFSEITVMQVVSFIKLRLASKVKRYRQQSEATRTRSSVTVHHEVALLSSVFLMAIRERVATENPVAAIPKNVRKLLRARNRRRCPLDDQKEDQLVEKRHLRAEIAMS
jgi:SEC-C motif